MENAVLCLPENAGRDVTTATYGNYKIGIEIIEDALCARLAELVHLVLLVEVETC